VNKVFEIFSKVLIYVFYGAAGIVVVVVGMLIASVGIETLRVAFSEADYFRVALTSTCLTLLCVIAPLSIYYFFFRNRNYPK
jgi:uncharacterized membrane protein